MICQKPYHFGKNVLILQWRISISQYGTTSILLESEVYVNPDTYIRFIQYLIITYVLMKYVEAILDLM